MFSPLDLRWQTWTGTADNNVHDHNHEPRMKTVLQELTVGQKSSRANRPLPICSVERETACPLIPMPCSSVSCPSPSQAESVLLQLEKARLAFTRTRASRSQSQSREETIVVTGVESILQLLDSNASDVGVLQIDPDSQHAVHASSESAILALVGMVGAPNTASLELGPEIDPSRFQAHLCLLGCPVHVSKPCGSLAALLKH